jgi:lipopolysaccharide biosynthesis regulator YciM
MDMGTASIIVAAITAVGGIIVAAINKFRKENKDDHAYVRGVLTMLYKSQNRIETKVDRVDERLSNHLELHASGGMLDNGRTVHQNGVEETGEVSS